MKSKNLALTNGIVGLVGGIILLFGAGLLLVVLLAMLPLDQYLIHQVRPLS
ncbi:hypothetical protein C7M47_00272 [Lactiplantibacillus plantarum]|nr:hypothetical protein C7M47_00272 [Lactiplantibacillus plantarum]